MRKWPLSLSKWVCVQREYRERKYQQINEAGRLAYTFSGVPSSSQEQLVEAIITERREFVNQILPYKLLGLKCTTYEYDFVHSCLLNKCEVSSNRCGFLFLVLWTEPLSFHPQHTHPLLILCSSHKTEATCQFLDWRSLMKKNKSPLTKITAVLQ